ncbi:MAG: cupin domain-containing protein [Deltaproteobacteria bacterium]|nr:cupin domain-containing protein [Deltaproteobacteria bacterium]
MKYKHNINDVPAETVVGRHIRNMVNGNILGSGEISLQVIDVLPGAVSKPGHFHNNCEEVILVESGQGDILIDDEIHHLKPGDVVLLPKGVKHLTRNPGDKPMRLICCFSCPDIAEGMVFDNELDYPD